MDLSEIKAPIAEHIALFEKRFKASMKSRVPLLDKITEYIVRRKGKQIRPLYVFFASELFGGINDKTYRAAALIELLHTATLIHDDVVDDSNERRGFFSLNALWKNKISVLVGDYLLSRGLLLSLENDDYDLLKVVADSVRKMSEGELLQIEKARHLDVEEAVYFDIIKKKTASLIASCLTCGALSASADKESARRIHEVGIHAGTAFQIKDDILDYQTDTAKGKPSGVDIKEGKITLPLIYVLGKSPRSEQRKLINIVKNHGSDSEKVAELTDMVHKGGGIRYAEDQMDRYKSKAIEMLRTFPDLPARRSLEQLILFTAERNL